MILAVTSLLAAFGVLALYSQFVSPVSPYASQLVVLIGLAVAVDYSLFMITRFRTERRRPRQAGRHLHGLEHGGPCRVLLGLAVMISIGGLFLLDDPLFRSMAIGTISVVFISVVGSLTFLPALLSILDENVNRFRLPFLGRQREEGSGPWSRVVRATMRRPILSFVVSAGFLLLSRRRSCACTSGRATSPRSPFDRGRPGHQPHEREVAGRLHAPVPGRGHEGGRAGDEGGHRSTVGRARWRGTA